MPQLNYRNPNVLKFVADGLQNWIQYMEIDGFKIGAANLITVDPNLSDDLYSIMPSDTYNGLDHVHTSDLTDSLDVVRDLVELLNRQNPDMNM